MSQTAQQALLQNSLYCAILVPSVLPAAFSPSSSLSFSLCPQTQPTTLEAELLQNYNIHQGTAFTQDN